MHFLKSRVFRDPAFPQCVSFILKEDLGSSIFRMNLGAVTASSTVSGGVGSRSNASQIADPPSLNKVHKNYADLQDLLANLPSKLNRVSNQVDKEFLSSYRVHMLSIQTELKNLKHDVTKGEQLLNSDATVAKLEAEAKWFADECGRLRQHHDSMFKDCEQIKQRLKAMKEQKVFLSEQLKALMKRNKILQVNLLQQLIFSFVNQ